MGKYPRRVPEGPNYRPNALFNHVLELMNLESDNQLAIALGVKRTRICNIRQRKENLSTNMLLALHDLTGLPASKLREWAGLM
jgi:plasmid maintenance system antidote protein VapI